MAGPELDGRDELVYYFFPPGAAVAGLVSVMAFAWLGWYGVNEVLFFAWPAGLVWWVIHVLRRNWRMAGQTYFLLWAWVLLSYVGAIVMTIVLHYLGWDEERRSLVSQRFGVGMLAVLALMGVVQFYIRRRWWGEDE
ncbi:hypothetical protein STSP2_00513 [Anaerohalosphaera lusitana]|uniref:Uncharacterized protein n=1 Tax=Anaerohalosphaera lusitana TaxID=1936003 RepID=A0A1U9NHI2_9BACT|nr:hypothetical protein [Anaerohalosphaera lusitana]AQT67369.1 hypothetical protein STSP2_00513 [Anaerohalosphaera lusitana]